VDVTVGRLAGFCPGIKNAVEGTMRLLESKDNVYCVGELAHNRQVVKSLRNSGLNIVDSIEEVPKGACVIFRAHGMPKKDYTIATRRNLQLYDYTCNKVKALHDKVEFKAMDGNYIFLLGDKNHVEVLGTKGFTREDNISVISDKEDLNDAFAAFDKSMKDELFVLAQTTFSLKKFEQLSEIIKREVQNRYDTRVQLEILNTICLATEQRQKEAEEMSKKVDYMVIIGGKNSANTKKLYEIAKEKCKNAIHIETKKDLKDVDFSNIKKVGVMAGASTPKESIDEVKEYLESL